MASTRDDVEPGVVTDNATKPVMFPIKKADARTALRNAYRLRYNDIETTTVTMEVPVERVIADIKMQFPFVDAEVRDEWEQEREE